MKPPFQPAFLLLGLAAALAVSCSNSPKDDATADSAVVSSPRASAWRVHGMRIPSTTTTTQESMGPDASLAGPGPLEEALAAQPVEPLPSGAALGQPNGEASTGPDGNSLIPTESNGRSPFDPAMPTPAPSNGAAPAPESPPPPTDSPAPPAENSPTAPQEETKPATEKPAN